MYAAVFTIREGLNMNVMYMCHNVNVIIIFVLTATNLFVPKNLQKQDDHTYFYIYVIAFYFLILPFNFFKLLIK